MSPYRATPKSSAPKRMRQTNLAKKRPGFRVSTISNPVSFGKYAMPLRIQNTHRYACTYDLALDALGNGQIAMRANGMFDPEVALGGHQPYYFDQIGALYNHFTVIKSKMTVRAVPVDDPVAGAAAPLMLSLFVDDDTTSLGTTLSNRERTGAQIKMLLPGQQQSPSVVYFNAQKMFGGNVMDNDELQGTVASDPAEEAIFFAYFSSGDPSGQVKVFIDIEYTAVWDELKSLPES